MEDTGVEADHDSARYMALCIEALSRLKPRDSLYVPAMQRILKDVSSELTDAINRCLHDIESSFKAAGWSASSQSFMPMDGAKAPVVSIGSLLRHAVSNHAQSRMSVFLQALFVQCERILHNHSFVIRTLHLIAEKQEAGDSVHKLIMGDEAVWRRMQDVLVDVFELYWERPSLDVFTDENVASTEEYEFTFVFEDAHGNDTPQDEEDASGAQASGAGRKGKINNVAGLEPSPPCFVVLHEHPKLYCKR